MNSHYLLDEAHEHALAAARIITDETVIDRFRGRAVIRCLGATVLEELMQ